MKTAVSIPDRLFESAEGFARRRGMSRNELYAKALGEYLEGQEAEVITERLDEVHGPEGKPAASTRPWRSCRRRRCPRKRGGDPVVVNWRR